MTKTTTRRSFLKHAAAAAAGPLIVPNLSLAAPPSSKLQHAAIGVMGMGRSDLREIYGSEKVDVVALCDIDNKHLQQAAKAFPEARLYNDWREMLAQEDRNIDSVNIAIPDHMHAPVAMTAIRNGKHVYCQKPLTHEVYEARKLTRAARRYDVATQMGIQIHSHKFYRTAVHWLKEGAIGKIKEWHSWSGASYTVPQDQLPPKQAPVPDHVHWDLWLGVAPERPYAKEIYHPFEWRRWRDFGSGATGDFGCHIFDPIFTALGIKEPLTVSAEVERFDEEVWPAWSVLHYAFMGTDMTEKRVIKATWSDGGKKPDKSHSRHLPHDYELPSSGSLVIGEEGSMILPHIGHPELYPVEKFKNYPKPELEPLNHWHEFVDAALGETTADANFDFSGPLTEAVVLGNIAGRFPGKTLEWEQWPMRFSNCREANDYVRVPYRDGWDVRGL